MVRFVGLVWLAVLGLALGASPALGQRVFMIAASNQGSYEVGGTFLGIRLLPQEVVGGTNSSYLVKHPDGTAEFHIWVLQPPDYNPVKKVSPRAALTSHTFGSFFPSSGFDTVYAFDYDPPRVTWAYRNGLNAFPLFSVDIPLEALNPPPDLPTGPVNPANPEDDLPDPVESQNLSPFENLDPFPSMTIAMAELGLLARSLLPYSSTLPGPSFEAAFAEVAKVFERLDSEFPAVVSAIRFFNLLMVVVFLPGFVIGWLAWGLGWREPDKASEIAP